MTTPNNTVAGLAANVAALQELLVGVELDAANDPSGQAKIAALNAAIAALASPAPSAPDIDAMVNRFLCWKLPDDFGPDAGVSFVPPLHPHGWPTGTNLLTAVQARAMFEHCMASAPSGVDLCEVARELERVHAEKVITDVAAIAGDRTDAYWSGHSQACEEIAHRLNLTPAEQPGSAVQGEK